MSRVDRLLGEQRRGMLPPPGPHRGSRRRVGAGATGHDDDAGTFLAAVTGVAAALRSGVPPSMAWQRGLGVRAVDGVPVWSDLVARWPDDVAAARAVQAAARLAAEVGAAPAVMLDQLATSLAREDEARAERAAALAGPQSTARILAWLPLLGLLLGVLLGADPVAVLLDGGAGTVMLCAGAALTWVGRRWTRRGVAAAQAAAGDARAGGGDP